ncbi:ATP-dependent helicase HrpB [Algicella marina]|uniref:ATP-dependent helicase HrpB n=1 Tax=Algicella marina TaxID=2683284 RepID=A0A6P1T0C3_9RHOB|nr:ATP-dependent helicase HrpB [Algicella marina]QHQ33952.1 ATP-dependent helicase HrpB [Algicella marina]
MPPAALPIEPVLAPLLAGLSAHGVAVLQAPPGAGKTTRVPLYLAEEAGFGGRILMLEPRRVAARAAAERLAEAWGEVPGDSVGYRMRGDSKPGRRIEVITEGTLARMIQSDPELRGISCVIFDEFHERALQSDLGLALCLEIRAALREDLHLLVMSATLDAEPVAALMGNAPVITSEGRAFSVEERFLDRPVKLERFGAFESAVADLVAQALAETEGGVLVFLPGKAEIARVAQRLRPEPGVEVMELHGGLSLAAQRRVVQPLEGRRKVVLSTAIAETSLTLADIRVVVDGGRARRARFDPGKGMARLVTERVSRAEATQRMGRAGRVAPGWCYRLWTKGEAGAMPAFAPPEIEVADLAPLALDLAVWGARQPEDLPFLTPPHPGSFAEARALLTELGALDESGTLTEAGRAMAAVPAHPRLARMLVAGGGTQAADLAALVEGRLEGEDVDLGVSLRALRGGDGLSKAARGALRQEAERLRRHAAAERGLSSGALLSLAYPDRIALRRPGGQPRYLLSGGAGGILRDSDSLAGQRLLVAADLDGDRREARIRKALAISESEVREVHGNRLKEQRICKWDRRTRSVQAREQVTLGALVLEERHWTGAGDDEVLPALLEGIRDLGLAVLPWGKAATALRARAEWARASGLELPPCDDASLMMALEEWLLPWMAGMRRLEDFAALDLNAALQARLGGLAEIDRLAPARFTAPTGTAVLIDYSGEAPAAQIRLQEVFGLTVHPVLGAKRLPLVLELLSPAGRPVQKTADLPGFWANSYADVRKDMRGRYPRHPWPENPAAATPTRRAKPRT